MSTNENSTSAPAKSTSYNSYCQQQQLNPSNLKGVIGNDRTCCGDKVPLLNWRKPGNQQTPGGKPTISDWTSKSQWGNDIAWKRKIPDLITLSLQLLCNQMQTLQADVTQLKTKVCHSNERSTCRRLVLSGPYHIAIIEGQSLNYNTKGFMTKEDCWVQAEKPEKSREIVSQELKKLAAEYKWGKNEEIVSNRRGRPSSGCVNESRTKSTRAVAHKLHMRSQWLRANWTKRGKRQSTPSFKTVGSTKSLCLKYKNTTSTPQYVELRSCRSKLKPDPGRNRTLGEKPTIKLAPNFGNNQISSAKPSGQCPEEDTQQTVLKISQHETSQRMTQVDFSDEDSSEEMLSSDIDYNRFTPREVGGYSADDEFW